MRVSIGADHAGYEMKSELIDFVRTLGHTVRDVGTFKPGKPDDCPDYAVLAAEDLRTGKADHGIPLCGSGVGVSIAANKFKGVRAAMCHGHYSAYQSVQRDGMNVLVPGARIIGQMMAQDAAQRFPKRTSAERSDTSAA
jgi:ribose 5-phosphate isomerase B